MEKQIAVLCVGEVLVDFIGNQLNKDVAHTNEYSRYLGGSPTNVAVNMSKLGHNAVIVGTCGNDGLGDFIEKKLRLAKVDITHVQRSDSPTSVIFVSRSQDTPDFIPYREADIHILNEQIPTALLERVRIFHTTCFALSKQPARTTIMHKAGEAFSLGVQLSIDLNFSERIWNSREDALAVVTSYCQYNPLIKISEDDVLRLFGKVLHQDKMFDFFHQAGAATVCFTKGNKGVVLSDSYKQLFYPAKPIADVKDTTGAGDAFWSGFLSAFLKKSNWDDCLKCGLEVAAIKLQHIGGLPNDIKKAF